MSTLTESIDYLKAFVPQAQLLMMSIVCRGEEGSFFKDLTVSYAERIKCMPKTYEQDGKGDQAVVHLHYFSGSGDWYITEKDSDPDGAGQVQAFGLADPIGDGGELGYISIQELIENNVELDLYFNPKPLADVRRKREGA